MPDMTEEQKNIYQDEFWCSCEEQDFDNAKFWDDGEHPKCSKHCWTCGTCGKLIQVG